jgi:hypothetical protein
MIEIQAFRQILKKFTLVFSKLHEQSPEKDRAGWYCGISARRRAAQNKKARRSTGL